MRRRVGFGTVALGCAAGAAAAIAIGARRWDRAIDAAVGRLSDHEAGFDAANAASAAAPIELPTNLPAPVARYFAFAMLPAQPRIRRARIRWAGELRAAVNQNWAPFRAVQHFSVQPPGSVWDATVRMGPMLTVRVLDHYVGGEASSQARVAALVSLGDQRGTPELAAASLVRQLAERVWLPTALLPSEGVAWTAIDEHTARATLADRGTSVWLDFHFGGSGEIVGFSGERHRDVNGQLVLTPWRGRFRDYARAGGLMVPMAAEVEWIPPEGTLPVWRGQPIGIGYAFGPG